MAKKKARLLTKAEEFYIEHNSTKPADELAKDLGLPLPVVVEHLHRTRVGGRISNLFIREKGCVVMTEGASMAADESRKGYVTEQAIRNAIARADYDEAARLQKLIKEQRHEDDENIRKRYADYIHYIQ